MENEIQWWDKPENKHLKKKLIELGINLENVSDEDMCPCIHLEYNKETAKALKESKKGKNIKKYKSVDDMFNKLGIK